MRNVLVLQWVGSTEADFEAVVDMEDELESRFGKAGIVDGHDFGSGEMNIFIQTDQPIEAYARAKEVLGNRPEWVRVRAGFREENGEAYDVLWPPDLTVFKVG